MDFGKRLRAARMYSGLTQQEAADAVHSSLRNYQSYEQGTRRPKYEMLAELAVLYGVTTDWLLGLTDEKQS